MEAIYLNTWLKSRFENKNENDRLSTLIVVSRTKRQMNVHKYILYLHCVSEKMDVIVILFSIISLHMLIG